jgi:hypothetical protein
MPTSHDAEALSEREAFENGYFYFVAALETLALPADAQCQRMGDCNVAWELKRDVGAAEYLLQSPSSARLSDAQRRAVEALLAKLARVPVDQLPSGRGRKPNLEAMTHESWAPLRSMAAEALRQLEPVTEECKRFLGMNKGGAN